MREHARQIARKAIAERKAQEIPEPLRKVWKFWDEEAPGRARREIREWVATGNSAALHNR